MKHVQTVRRLGRREALQICGATFAVGGLGSLIGCSKEAGPGSTDKPGASAAGAPSCSSAIEAESAQLRLTLQYKDVAAVPDKHCSDCAQYLESKYGECGGCNLFTGPVKPKGGCLAFAPKGAPGAAPGAAPAAAPGAAPATP